METTQTEDDGMIVLNDGTLFRPHKFAESKVAKKTVSWLTMLGLFLILLSGKIRLTGIV